MGFRQAARQRRFEHVGLPRKKVCALADRPDAYPPRDQPA
jgi:hypothetical protein